MKLMPSNTEANIVVVMKNLVIPSQEMKIVTPYSFQKI